MSIDVKIPSMGESITGGILAAWHVQNGDFVKRDQVIYELETDKITSEGLAESDGRLAIEVEAGTEVTIGQKVAVIDTDQVAPEAPAAPAASKAPEPPPPAVSKPVPPETPEPAVTADTPEPATPAVSPAVRRLAEESGINPASVAGTGKAGRVTKGDMLKAMEKPFVQPEVPAPAPATPPPVATPSPVSFPPTAEDRVTRKKMSPLRQRIAQRLVASQQDAAILSTFNEADMRAVKDLRARYQDAFVKRHEIKLGFMSFFIKAVVHALKEVPAVNARIEGDTIVQNHFYDIGVAVSTEKGLLVPVIRNCDQLSLAEIEAQLIAYGRKARDGKITIQDLEGGIFTVSNGGIFGSLLSTPIINPPQAGILGMHAIQDRPVALNGEIVIRPMMYLALSYDHRLVDGREAVTFLVKVKEAIEDPARLVIGI